jgi:bifunctional UDP-N-acetylglucosamine pyrophosphorylase/glucosamine-1-phosphate N-acetyltransferase
MSNKLAVVILAAGQGTRMKSDIPKVMHEIAGLPMISWLIRSVEQLAPEKIITVIAPDMADVAAAVSPHVTAIQETQNGTADAVKPALEHLKDFDGQVLIVMGDEPFVPVDALGDMAARGGLSVMAFETDMPDGLGRVVLNDDGTFGTIVEDKDCSTDQRGITLCNAGNYCVPSSGLSKWLDTIDSDNAQGEYYLTDLPHIAAKDGVSTNVVTIPWHGAWGINNKVQLAEHEMMVQDSMRRHAMMQGAILQDPSSVYFSHDTTLGEDVTIEPHVYFGEGVHVGDDVHIKAFCHFDQAKIGNGVTIGPYARLRPGAELGDDVRIGNFVEIKKSTIGAGSKINHFGYVGDATIGKNVNFSCGAITVNYDGFKKHETIIGDDVMVGSNVNLVAPINVGDGVFIAAGSTISKDIPADALAIERDKARVLDGWAAKNRKDKV